ncbi:MAG: macro domain-containing protein [Desulfurococcales archaeon]|nr:macro domain-containing protein [Desulfurococcales archaeon]
MARCFKANGSLVQVLEGDITQLDVDAIVNPANSRMIMGGGVAGAIKRRGGREIEEEAMRHAPVPIGSAISTGAGRLKAKYVIHAPTMEMPAMRIPLDNVYKATRAALEEAERLGIKSLAIPAMGAGVGGISPRDSFKAMLETITSYRGSLPSRIVLVAWGREAYEAGVEAALSLGLEGAEC